MGKCCAQDRFKGGPKGPVPAFRYRVHFAGTFTRLTLPAEYAESELAGAREEGELRGSDRDPSARGACAAVIR